MPLGLSSGSPAEGPHANNPARMFSLIMAAYSHSCLFLLVRKTTPRNTGELCLTTLGRLASQTRALGIQTSARARVSWGGSNYKTEEKSDPLLVFSDGVTGDDGPGSRTSSAAVCGVAGSNGWSQHNRGQDEKFRPFSSGNGEESVTRTDIQ